jgi:16S rRNA processing protein RimM
VVSCRPHGNVAVVKIEGVDTIEQAKELRNTVFYIKRSDVKLPEGKWFVSELIGCTVIDVDDNSKEYGTLKDVETLVANDIWYIDTPNGEVIIPAIKDVVIKCDVADNKVYIRALRGLFEDED